MAVDDADLFDRFTDEEIAAALGLAKRYASGEELTTREMRTAMYCSPSSVWWQAAKERDRLMLKNMVRECTDPLSPDQGINELQRRTNRLLGEILLRIAK